MLEVWLSIAVYFSIPIVIAEAQCEERKDGRIRVHCYALIFERLWRLWSGWVFLDEVKAKIILQKTKVKIYFGTSDAMFATSPVYVWSKIGEVLLVWRRGSLVLKVCVQKIVNVGSNRAPIKNIQAIHCGLREKWSKHTISAITDVETIELICRSEYSALYDPTYDGLDLLQDSSWLISLGRAIADAVHAKLTVHPDL